jgi:hypothetical protein
MGDKIRLSIMPAAGRWTIFWARVFGKKIVRQESSHTLTGYYWRGALYVSDFK